MMVPSKCSPAQRPAFCWDSSGKERDETGFDYFLARYYSDAMGRFTSTDPIWVKADRLMDPQRLNLYSYSRNNPLRFTDPTGMDLAIGICIDGDPKKCAELLKKGLRIEDRQSVHIIIGNGKNGFKEGQLGIRVDKNHESDSDIFQTLQKLANDHSAIGIIDVVGKGNTITIKTTIGWDKETGNKLVEDSMEMVGKDLPFAGFTFFQYRGKTEPGIIYTPGEYSQVVINSIDMTDLDIIQKMHHELVHLLLGDFGRSALKAKHSPTFNFDGIPRNSVDQKTVAAEEEAKSNAAY